MSQPRFDSMDERRKLNWLMKRCPLVRVITRSDGSTTMVVDMRGDNGVLLKFETTLPDRQAAIAHACERVYHWRTVHVSPQSGYRDMG